MYRIKYKRIWISQIIVLIISDYTITIVYNCRLFIKLFYGRRFFFMLNQTFLWVILSLDQHVKFLREFKFQR